MLGVISRFGKRHGPTRFNVCSNSGYQQAGGDQKQGNPDSWP